MVNIEMENGILFPGFLHDGPDFENKAKKHYNWCQGNSSKTENLRIKFIGIFGFTTDHKQEADDDNHESDDQ